MKLLICIIYIITLMKYYGYSVKKTFPPLSQHLPPSKTPCCKNFNFHPRKKTFNEYYVEFDFRRGTVRVIFSFLWMDNDILPLERNCLLRYHIPAIPIPSQRSVVQKLFVRFSWNLQTVFQTIERQRIYI